jgi:hypothetical protein
MLLGFDAAKEVLLGGRVGLVIEDRRMTRMGDEVSNVRPVGHFTGMRGGGIKHNECCAGIHFVDDTMCNLADQPVGHGHENNLSSSKSLILVNAVCADNGFQTLAPLF